MRRARSTGLLLYCGMLAPMFRIAPGSGAAAAMEGAWVSPLLAYLLVVPFLWVLVRVCRALPAGPGLPKLYEMAFGTRAGRLATALTGLWAAVLGAAALRYCSESIVATVYQDTSIWIFLLCMSLLIWRTAGRGMETLCRLAKAYLIIIGSVLALVLVLSLREIEVEHLWPVWRGGWRGMLASVLPVLGVLGPMMLILFRRTEGPGERRGGGALILWLGASCLTMAAVRSMVIGMFGWETAVRLQTPLFSVAKEVYLLQVFERIEALVVAVWVLSCLVWVSSLLLVAAVDVEHLIGRHRGTVTVLSALMLLTAAWSGGNFFRVRWALLHGGQWVNFALCYGLPLAAAALARHRGRLGTQDVVGDMMGTGQM